MLPSNYKPKTVTQFIGSARKHAGMIDKLIAAASGDPLKFLFSGPPGTGKSSLAEYAQAQLGCDKWTTTKLNGTQARIEVLDDLARSLHYKDMFGKYRLVWIEEADKIPNLAQVRFLTILDELPHQAAVICTSNTSVKDFEPRFHSRFQFFEVKGPEATELEGFLAGFLPEKARATARHIATLACGNVRQALLDCQTALFV
jgi:replication-associated recombination protein RarA